MEKKYDAGRVMLFSVGIFMIIRGAFDIYSSNIYTAYMAHIHYTTLLESWAGNHVVGFIYISALVVNIFFIVLGILGIVFSKDPAKGKMCFSLAVVLLVLLFIQSFYPNASMVAFEPFDRLGHIITGLGTGLFATVRSAALPVLFMIGAHINMKAHAEKE